MKTSAPVLSVRALNRATLARQMLLRREKMTPLAAIERLVAMQAQVPKPPFIGLWTRLAKFERDDLLELLNSKKAVRATAIRATIHLMTAKDFIELRGAMQPGLDRGTSVLGGRDKGLDKGSLEKIARDFFGKGRATFDDLRKHLEQKSPKGDIRAMAYSIRLFVPLVQVPTDATWGFPGSAEFALADEWLGKKISTKHAPPDELIRRYLAAFGPATPGDFQVWCYTKTMREEFERMRPELVTFQDERKRELFDLPDAPRPDEDTPAPIRFLPDYDNLVLSHDDRTRILADEHRSRILTPNLQVRGSFLVDGFVAGSWSTKRQKKTATLVLEPFGKLAKKVVTELEEEGEALLRFAEADAEIHHIQLPR